MEQTIFDSLFSKEGLNYNESIHKNLVLNLCGILLKALSENQFKKDEYFIHDKIDTYLHRRLENTEFESVREIKPFGLKKIDNAIVLSSNNEGLVYYEVKSFIKKNEYKISPSKVYQDIIKLALTKKVQPECKAFLLFAGRTDYIKGIISSQKTFQLPSKYDDLNKSPMMELGIDLFKASNVEKSFVQEMEKTGIDKISISPSRWNDYEGISVLTWKINKI